MLEIFERSSPFKKLVVIWFAFAILASCFLSFTNFVSESHDSRFYSGQVVFYQNASMKELLAPKWNDDSYGFDPKSYMRDQFPGHLIMGVAVTKLGVPAKHALHILELFFQIASILLILEICRYFASEFKNEKETMIVCIGLLLFPMAFSYNIRGNHESGIAFFSALALLSGLRLNQGFIWSLLSILACFFLLIIKGPFIIFGFLLTGLGFIFSKEVNRPYLKIILTFLIGLLIAATTLYLFEENFIKITGESFLKEFYQIQFKTRALDLVVPHPLVIQKSLNFWYYFNHCLTYSLPWSLIALIAIIKNKFKDKNYSILFIKSKLSMALFFSAMIYCAVFSASNRLAGRYNHPAYYFFTAWCVLLTYFNIPSMQNFIYKLTPIKLISIITGLWLLAFVIHFI